MWLMVLLLHSQAFHCTIVAHLFLSVSRDMGINGFEVGQARLSL